MSGYEESRQYRETRKRAAVQRDRRRRRRRRRIGSFLKGLLLAAVFLAVCAAALRIAGLDGLLRERLGVFALHGWGGGSAARHRDVQQYEEGDWSLILVNRWNPIPEDYEIELMELSNGESVDARIYPALQDMFDDMRQDGVYPVVASGYRTAQTQQALLDDKIAEYQEMGYSEEDARVRGEDWVAVPGTSEHQLGLGVDINADGLHSSGDEVYDWLARYAYRYGFIRRYPPDKTEITGIINEPWHYRYVGQKAAEEIRESGLCLEEYLEKK